MGGCGSGNNCLQYVLFNVGGCGSRKASGWGTRCCRFLRWAVGETKLVISHGLEKSTASSARNQEGKVKLPLACLVHTGCSMQAEGAVPCIGWRWGEGKVLVQIPAGQQSQSGQWFGDGYTLAQGKERTKAEERRKRGVSAGQPPRRRPSNPGDRVALGLSR